LTSDFDENYPAFVLMSMQWPASFQEIFVRAPAYLEAYLELGTCQKLHDQATPNRRLDRIPGRGNFFLPASTRLFPARPSPVAAKGRMEGSAVLAPSFGFDEDESVSI
jgi:hypothetical protein